MSTANPQSWPLPYPCPPKTYDIFHTHQSKVFSGFTLACCFTIYPTNLSPIFVYATTDSIVRCPSAVVTVVGFPPSIAAIVEFVVSRSIQITFLLTTLTRLMPELMQSRKKANSGVLKEALLGDTFWPKKIEFGREEEGIEVEDVQGVPPRTLI